MISGTADTASRLRGPRSRAVPILATLFSALGLWAMPSAGAQPVEWGSLEPAPRAAPIVYDLARGVTVMFGGNRDSPYYYGDTWECDGNSWTRHFVAGPSPRFGH